MSTETARKRVAPAVLSVAALFLVLIAVARFQGIPEFTPPDLLLPVSDKPEPSPPAGELDLGLPQTEPDPLFTTIMSIVLTVLGIAVAVGVLWLLVRTAMQLWSQRRLRRREGASLATGLGSPAAEEEADTRVVRTGIAAALHDIEGRPDPGDAIIAAWVGLEQSAAQAGFVRAAAETPAEFTRRIIVRTAGAAAEVDRLLRLYERVRFGGHLADEHDRAQARASLRRIQEVTR